MDFKPQAKFLQVLKDHEFRLFQRASSPRFSPNTRPETQELQADGGEIIGGHALFMAREEEDTTIYRVVMNHEEQYSIWPAEREDAAGWKDVGKSGTKAECLAYIKDVWTDMRPLSVRKRMESAAATPTQPPGRARAHH